MNEIGLPSPFIDIMMFRPGLAHFGDVRLESGSVARTTLSGIAQIAHQVLELVRA